MFTTLTGVTSELKQSEIDTNLVPESEIRPNLHIAMFRVYKHYNCNANVPTLI